MDIIEALKIIIAKSPNAAEEAIRTIAAARNNSPILQVRYSNVLIRALADPRAEFTPDERELLAAVIETPGTATRDFTLNLRLTSSERVELEQAAQTAGLSLSEYSRQQLFSGLFK
jgi:hypothetical protein